MSDCQYEHEGGAYVLGALAHEERIAFERHLPGCPDCARSVRELAGLPGLLARVPVEVLESPPLTSPVPDTLLPGLVRRARRSRQRQRWMTGGVAAAAVAAAVVLITTIGHDTAPPVASPSASRSTAAPRQLRAIGAQPISGWVSLTKVAFGTRVDLTCQYSEDQGSYPDSPDLTYTMYVIRADGTTEQVASWKGLPGRTTHVGGTTATNVHDITGVQIRAAAGDTVLELG